MTFDHDFCSFILLFFFPLFLGRKRKGEKGRKGDKVRQGEKGENSEKKGKVTLLPDVGRPVCQGGQMVHIIWTGPYWSILVHILGLGPYCSIFVIKHKNSYNLSE